MKPAYQSPSAEVYHARAEELLRSLRTESVSGVITDPPYSSGGLFRGDRADDPVKKYEHSGTRGTRHGFSGDNRDQRSFNWWLQLWLSECYRVLIPTGYVMVFTDWRQLPTVTDAVQGAGFIWRGTAVWDKGRGARSPHKGYIRHQAEFIVWGTKGRCRKALHDGPLDGVLKFPVLQNDKHHVCGKPTALMKELVRLIDPEGTIVDPFCGSGTTGVAALESGRRFIGSECDSAHVATTIERLKAQK